MKRQTQFSHLPEADRQHILDLCAKHTYARVVELLRQDRPVGLNLETNISALSRFFIASNTEAEATACFGQFARAVQIQHQANGGGNTEALLALAQNALLKALQEGTPLADLASEFRILNNLHRAYLAEDARRKQWVQDRFEDALRDHLEETADLPEADFTLLTPSQPTPPAPDPKSTVTPNPAATPNSIGKSDIGNSPSAAPAPNPNGTWQFGTENSPSTPQVHLPDPDEIYEGFAANPPVFSHFSRILTNSQPALPSSVSTGDSGAVGSSVQTSPEERDEDSELTPVTPHFRVER